jgi:hypothetical protein
MLLPILWAAVAAESGLPANVCADACATIRQAYLQIGINAELKAVDLVIADASGQIFTGGRRSGWRVGLIGLGSSHMKMKAGIRRSSACQTCNG